MRATFTAMCVLGFTQFANQSSNQASLKTTFVMPCFSPQGALTSSNFTTRKLVGELVIGFEWQADTCASSVDFRADVDEQIKRHSYGHIGSKSTAPPARR